MDALGIDIKLLAAQIVNFVLFFLIFKKFIAGPFFTYLKEQEKIESEKIKIKSDLETSQKRVEEEEKKLIAAARAQGLKIIKEAKETAEAVREDVIKKAQNEAADIRDKAAKQLETERETLYREVRANIITTSAAIAKKALHQVLGKNEQSQIYDELSKKLNSKQLYEN